MEIIQSTYDISSKLPRLYESYFASQRLSSEEIAFFDIETTGLSPKISSLTVVGCCHFADDHLVCTQWFADDYVSEPQILASLTDYLQDFKAIISYNGTGFDVPYLQKKYSAHHVPSSLSEKAHIDLYKILRPYKSILCLENMKLQTLEAFLALPRTDHYSGKDCINLYSEFVQGKYLDAPDALQCKEHLLQHNLEDIIGTCLIGKALSLVLPFQNQAVLSLVEQSQDYITFSYPMDFSIEHAIDSSCPCANGRLAAVSIQNDSWNLTLRIEQGIRYHFFADYKNYYYLPAEDQAIHKDVAAYVDSDHKEKATAANCYTKKEGLFLPILQWKKRDTSFHDIPLFFNLSKTQAYVYWDGTLPEDYLLQLAAFF